MFQMITEKPPATNPLRGYFQDFVLVTKRQGDLCFTNLYEKQLIFRIIPFESLPKNQNK